MPISVPKAIKNHEGIVIEAIPLSIYAKQPYPRAGLLFGFTAVARETVGPKVV